MSLAVIVITYIYVLATVNQDFRILVSVLLAIIKIYNNSFKITTVYVLIFSSVVVGIYHS